VLAKHPATAKHIAHSLAEEFVGENPSNSLVQSLAATFSASHGDIRAVLRTLVQSKEFWTQAAARQKVKSPFEYAVSALRASQAEISDTRALTRQIATMGQPLYAYLDSSGVPVGKQWITGGNLTTRVQFALDLDGNRIDGVRKPIASAQNLAVEIAGPQFQLR
jgi:uncharacterized protein (DUF1800 family)